MAVRRIRIALADVVRMGSLLAGYDGLVWVYSDPGSTEVLLVCTPDSAAELDAVLDGLHTEVEFEVLAAGAEEAPRADD
jgi:hypothetical protein